jgi:hypothetical protein
VVWPQRPKAACLLLAMAPVGIALGFPFALGMAALRPNPQFLPWAWSLNGAFSVVASPLAYLLVLGQGNRILLLLSMLLYLMVWLTCLQRAQPACGSEERTASALAPHPHERFPPPFPHRFPRTAPGETMSPKTLTALATATACCAALAQAPAAVAPAPAAAAAAPCAPACWLALEP